MLNKVQFIGHLGRDPELRSTPNGAQVCTFSVASTEKWKDKASGERREETEWLRCTAFDRLAEVCGEYLAKGSLVYVEGRLKTRKYKDKDGTERSITECRVNEMKMLRDAPQDEAPAPAPARQAAPPQRSAPQQRSAPAQRQSRPSGGGTGFDDMEDDIPFTTSDSSYDMDSRMQRRARRWSCK